MYNYVQVVQQCTMIGKRQIHLYLDENIYNRWIRSKQIKNITERISDLIILDSNVTPTQKKRHELEEEIRVLDNNISSLRIELSDLQVKEEEERQKKIEEDSMLANKLKKCIQCGNDASTIKNHKFPKGSVCHACFMSAQGEDIKRWEG